MQHEVLDGWCDMWPSEIPGPRILDSGTLGPGTPDPGSGGSGPPRIWGVKKYPPARPIYLHLSDLAEIRLKEDFNAACRHCLITAKIICVTLLIRGKTGDFCVHFFFHYFSVFSKKWKNVKKWHFLTILCHFSAPGYYDLWNQVFFRDLKNVTFCHFGKCH